MKKIRIAALLVLVALLLTGCAGKSIEQQLNGTWMLNGRTEVTFYDDGTYTMPNADDGTWNVVNGNTLKLTTVWKEVMTFSIESINDTQLTLSFEGETQTFTKRK